MHEDIWRELRRPTPDWFAAAKFGIFIHWGAYSVPAWAEPSGALGTIPDHIWYAHNPYAEWYANTIRIAGSPAAQHHEDVYGNTPYDDFIDQWTADEFDPDDWAALFAHVGADYVVPTTKHHDGVALWDAPGTGSRNTVHRGPQRDLIEAIATAVRNRGIRFGVYYSGGLDWSVTDLPPQTSNSELLGLRPRDAAYNVYADGQVRDLIARYRPDILWNDIEWPDSGKRNGPSGLVELFKEFYLNNPEGVVNDRWGVPHYDFLTSEYEHAAENEDAEVWENTRGVGFSFGYNSLEGAQHTLTPAELARHWSDVVARGGRLLLNVGPTASGRIPELQRSTLESFGDWKRSLTRFAASTQRSTQPAQDAGWRREWATNEGTVVLLGAGNHAIDHDARASVTILAGQAELTGGRAIVAEGMPAAILISS